MHLIDLLIIRSIGLVLYYCSQLPLADRYVSIFDDVKWLSLTLYNLSHNFVPQLVIRLSLDKMWFQPR